MSRGQRYYRCPLRVFRAKTKTSTIPAAKLAGNNQFLTSGFVSTMDNGSPPDTADGRTSKRGVRNHARNKPEKNPPTCAQLSMIMPPKPPGARLLYRPMP